MQIEERRLLVQKAYELHRDGVQREKIYDFLLTSGIPKSEISVILDSNEERFERQINIKKAETDLTLPLFAFFGGLILLILALLITFAKRGYLIISTGSLILFALGSVFIIAGIITFFLKLRNKMTKNYKI